MADRLGDSLKPFELSGVLETGRELGRGAYAAVVEVEHNGIKLAAKKIHEILLLLYDERIRTSLISRIVEEYFLHSRLNHPNIVQFVGVYYDSVQTLPALVTELLPTTLALCLDQHGVLSAEASYSILRDVALGLQYLHDRFPPIVHCDLNPRNILLTVNMRAKIFDFGAAMQLDYSQSVAQVNCPGALFCMPPEAFSDNPHYDTKLDIFSYGVVMLYVFTGRFPDPGGHTTVVNGEVVTRSEVERRQDHFDWIGPDHPLRSLIEDCLNNNPDHRPTVSHVLHRIEAVAFQDIQSRRLFDEAMKKGYVDARLLVLLLIGAAGAGKTHAKHLILGLDPPTMRVSTPLLEEAIRAISTIRATVSGSGLVWDPVTLEKLKQMIAAAVKGEGYNVPSPQQHSPVPVAVGEFRAPPGDTNPAPLPHSPLDSEPTSRSRSAELPSSDAPSDSFRHVQEEEFIELVTSSSGSGKLLEVDWVYLVDSGGQPCFHEIASLFIRKASVVAFIVKLSELLSDRPTVDFYGQDGQKCGSSYSSPFTNEQILRHCFRAMHSRQGPSQDAGGPAIFVIGTHRDLEDTCDESRSEKNSKLLKILRPSFDEKLGYYRVTKPEEILYPVNAKTPTEEDKVVAQQFRKAVIEKCSNARVRIPMPWFVLEQYIRELAAAMGRKILSTGECEKEANRLHMKQEACEAALVYLDELNMFFYRPKHLKGVVFCGSQVLLDKITELSEYIHRLQGKTPGGPINNDRPIQSPDIDDVRPTQPVRAAMPGIPWWQTMASRIRSLFQTQPRLQSPIESSSEDLPFPPPQATPTNPRPDHLSQSLAPDLSGRCGYEWLKFRDYGIVTIKILKEFPKHYVEGLFTPTEFLKLLTAFLVTAPVSDGSPEYVMPCLLQELASPELEKYRQHHPSSPAAPLLIVFSDNWVPAGIFTVLVAYLQNIAHWQLCLSSGNPCCLYRNCVEFDLPTGRRGSVTLVDSYEYIEVHVEASGKSCQKVCPQITHDILSGIEEAARRLHYSSLEPKIAFFCPTPSPACSPTPHPANLVDDELVCSQNRKIGDDLTSRHDVWLDKSHGLKWRRVSFGSQSRTPEDFTNFPVPELWELNEVAASFPHLWRSVGIGLKVSDGKLTGIQIDHACRPRQTQECFTDVFRSWKEGMTSPYTWKNLVTVLRRDDLATDTQATINRLFDTLSHRHPN